MKRRPADDDDGASLDSLLDTLTNVVGILVIVLVVTQLGVGDAVKRIAESDAVSPEALEAAKKKLAETAEQRRQLEQQLAELKPVDATQLAQQLMDLEGQIAQRQVSVKVLTDQQKAQEEKTKKDQELAEQAKKEIEDNKNEADSLKQELNSVMDQMARLNAILAETPERTQLPPKIVNMPDPRPAPEGAKPVHFVCVDNKVYPLNIDGARDTARKRAEYLVGAKRLVDPVQGIDPEKFLEEFNKLTTLRDDFFEIEMSVSGGRYPRVAFVPRPEGGFEIKEIQGVRSRFRRLMELTDKTKYYARFFVLPDSYEAYIEARAVCQDVGLLAGWEPQAEGWRYSTNLGGPLRLGPPMPDPPPKPRTGPAKPAAVID